MRSAIVLMMAASPAHAEVLLDFEGLADQDDVLEFYNGGMSSSGAMGTDFGISFTNGLALIDSDAGGTGNFANEPSPDTALFAGEAGGPIIIDVPSGFVFFSTFYVLNESLASIEFYDGPKGTGNLLLGLDLAGPPGGGMGDPHGDLNQWVHTSLDLGDQGVPALSLVIAPEQNTSMSLDNMSFVLVPAPGGLALLALAGVRPGRRHREDMLLSHMPPAPICYARILRCDFTKTSGSRSLPLPADR